MLSAVFLPGESHGWRSLAGYSLWGSKSQTRFSGCSSTTTTGGRNLGWNPRVRQLAMSCRRAHVCILTFTAPSRTNAQDEDSSPGAPRGPAPASCVRCLPWADPGLPSPVFWAPQAVRTKGFQLACNFLDAGYFLPSHQLIYKILLFGGWGPTFCTISGWMVHFAL